MEIIQIQNQKLDAKKTLSQIVRRQKMSEMLDKSIELEIQRDEIEAKQQIRTDS